MQTAANRRRVDSEQRATREEKITADRLTAFSDPSSTLCNAKQP
jgi:hypothetical protein